MKMRAGRGRGDDDVGGVERGRRRWEERLP